MRELEKCVSKRHSCFSKVLKEKLICGSKTKIVTGGWRKLHNEELNNIYGDHTLMVLTCCISENSCV
jgi:hypothetical protein